MISCTFVVTFMDIYTTLQFHIDFYKTLDLRNK